MSSRRRRDPLSSLNRFAHLDPPGSADTSVQPKGKVGASRNDPSSKVDHVWIEPERIRTWRLANRKVFNDESMSELQESIRNNGQEHPALVRPTPPDQGHEFELIYGARRLEAAKRLGVKLKCIVNEIDDRSAVLSMDAENRVRTDITPYERGADYAQWLSEGLFENATTLGEQVGVSATSISKLLKIATLPESVLYALPNSRDLSLAYGYELATACPDEQSRARVDRAAVDLARRHDGENISAASAKRILLDAAKDRSSELTSSAVAQTVNTSDGGIRARLNVTRSGEITVRTSRIESDVSREALTKAIVRALESFAPPNE